MVRTLRINDSCQKKKKKTGWIKNKIIRESKKFPAATEVKEKLVEMTENSLSQSITLFISNTKC